MPDSFLRLESSGEDRIKKERDRGDCSGLLFYSTRDDSAFVIPFVIFEQNLLES